MKSYHLKAITLAIMLCIPLHASADTKSWEWLGEYTMNHDGWIGTLSIRENKADCMTSSWCSMAIHYKTSKGEHYQGRIEKINEKGQHMVFHLNFPNNTQKFDAYLFSWDKNKMAGITYWGGRKFGFYATK
ncbi:MAG: hypothetical protein KAG10_00425 [Methylococcales bacterium]|nr:hypothetical protein [Methylococcales bacterium]MCK5924336.1 hypothetical protein [Methylococcales bacterium]